MNNTEIMSQQDLDTFFALHNYVSATDPVQHIANSGTSSNALSANNGESSSLESAFQELSSHSTAVSSPLTPGTPITRPKLGSRFSREVIRILKDWLAVRQQHPYPNEDEMIDLQRRTGLNKAQLTNWFANARRRGKVQGTRPVSPQVTIQTNPMEIMQRPGTPAIRSESHNKDPLQRWVDSPPEHEPATAHAIAKAMASNSRRSSQERGDPSTWTNPWLSPYAKSSASSAATSQSSGEFSAYQSSGSQSSMKIRGPRKKRASRRRHLEQHSVTETMMPYQCTFCTEVFKTKYDWQRHEKSLHLPLEKWICALHGPRGPKETLDTLDASKTSETCCVFCGEVTPSDSHLEGHHYSACQERSLEERTFHRKDHLVQHLRLVHGAKFAQWSMARWMLPMPNIKSRCGFCSISLGTWEERTDHIAEHFKSGATMAKWHGDWGFDQAILDMVESAIPPYFVDYERTTLIPMKGSDPPWGSPPNAYELLKVELEFYIQNYFDKFGNLPTNDAMQLEACRIIFAGEVAASVHLNTTELAHSPSWLRDLIMSTPKLVQQARFGPIRTSSESRHSILRINGKDHLFEMCPLEAHLHAYVLSQQILNAPIEDFQLQSEASAAVRRMEGESDTPSDLFANWVVKGIFSGTDWLAAFKQRASLTITPHTLKYPQCGEVDMNLEWASQSSQSIVPPNESPFGDTAYASASITAQASPFSSADEVNATIPTPANAFDSFGRLRILLPDDTNFYRIFDSDMKRWAAATMSPKNPNCHVPSDEEIQHQARWIMYDGDDPWNQTPADYQAWLQQFKKRAGITASDDVVDPKALIRG